MRVVLQLTIQFEVDGRQVEVADDGTSLLEVLRDRLGIRSPKDGCSPQGQCGCCTVLVDGQPRVACVTPARRVQGRAITTLDGLDPDTRERWAGAFCATGASQCGFCTPGIIMRLEGLVAKKPDATEADVERGLQAHLCRCTGWRTILDAWDQATGSVSYGDAMAGRDAKAAARRAAIEGRSPQSVGPHVALGEGGFADDGAPTDALVAVPIVDGGWVVADTLIEARRAAGKIQGRRTTVDPEPPIELPDGEWAVTLRTSWVEPGYLEPDASWCLPGGEPVTPLANGGAFGAKLASVAPEAARRLADEHGRAVRVVVSREDTVRLGPKRPPIAAGVRADGTGVVRVARTPGIVDAIRSVAPGFEVEEVDVAGPPTSAAIRGAGWVEAAVLLAALRGDASIVAPDGGHASASVADGAIRVQVRCGDPLDEVVLHSYCVGAAHMATSWVCSEGLAVDPTGDVHDLTVRSFAILRAVDTPPIEVEIDPTPGPSVNGSDAVFAAVAAAVWQHQGLPGAWPTGHTVRAT